MVKELQEKGVLFQTLLTAQTRAEEMADRLFDQGVTDPLVREELILADLFLPDENRVPILGEPAFL